MWRPLRGSSDYAALWRVVPGCPWRGLPASPFVGEGSRPPEPLWNPDMYALHHDAETAAAVACERPPLPLVSGLLRGLCGHVWIRLPLGSALSTVDYGPSTFSLSPLEWPLAGGYDCISSEMNTYEKRWGGSPHRDPLCLRKERPEAVNNPVENAAIQTRTN